jgi:GGDEF domain-containing protein
LIRDISEKIKAEEKVAYAASHDYLTGLPNRYFFKELFEKEISQSKRRKDSFAIVYVDLDGNIIEIKASIGISVYPDDGNDSEILLKKADEAMYMVKNTLERNNWRFYS